MPGEVVKADARIVRLSISRGSVPKWAVLSARVTSKGLERDGEHAREHHGSPEREFCLFSLERILALQAEGHPISCGNLSENLAIDRDLVTPGLYLLVKPAVIPQVTRYPVPCGNITGSSRDQDYSHVSQRRHPGDNCVHARVLREGALASTDPVRLLRDDEALGLIGTR